MGFFSGFKKTKSTGGFGRIAKSGGGGSKGFFSQVAKAVQKTRASTPAATKRTGGFGSFSINAAANNTGKRTQAPSGLVGAAVVKALKSR